MSTALEHSVKYFTWGLKSVSPLVQMWIKTHRCLISISKLIRFENNHRRHDNNTSSYLRLIKLMSRDIRFPCHEQVSDEPAQSPFMLRDSKSVQAVA